MPLITAAGFAPEDAHEDAPGDSPGWVSPEEAEGEGLALRVETGADVDALAPLFPRARLIGIAYGGFADGRVFGMGARLRRLGYRGRLRAIGPMIVDQAAYAFYCGFDEIEIDAETARRQPEPLWLRALAAGAAPPTVRRGIRRAA